MTQLFIAKIEACTYILLIEREGRTRRISIILLTNKYIAVVLVSKKL